MNECPNCEAMYKELVWTQRMVYTKNLKNVTIIRGLEKEAIHDKIELWTKTRSEEDQKVLEKLIEFLNQN